MNTESITTCTNELYVGNTAQIPLESAMPMDHQKSIAANPTPDLSTDQRERLLSPSFLGLLFTQFLGATNDNLFRWLIAFIGGDLAVHDPAFRWLVSWVNSNPTAETYKEIAVSAGLAMLVLPFIVLAAPAGYCADRFSKRTIIVSCKVAEIILMILGVIVILHGNVWLMFCTLFLMGSHSAIFGPSKYGSIPEIVRVERISAANGLIGMTTILAIVLGTVGAGYLYEWTKPLGQTNSWLWASTIVSVAVAGLLTSLPIRRLANANPSRKFPINFAAETYNDFRTLFSIRALFLTACASMLFWSLGGLCQININSYGATHLNLSKDHVSLLVGTLAVGVGIGSVLAGIISRKRIVMALVPIGAAGLALTHILLYFLPAGNGHLLTFSYISTAVCLFSLGLSGGIYDVPLQAYLQHNSPEKTRGSIFAATNFMTFTGTFAASGMYILMVSVLKLSAPTIFILVGIALLPLVVVLIYYTAFDSTRMLVVTLSHLMYKTRIEGLENIPATGALITPNHVSWADGILIGLACPRHPRMVVFADYFETPWLGWFGRLGRVIPIKPGRKSMVQSLRVARQALKDGELVCLFPEGGITRTGEMNEFKPGALTILKETNTPVIPVNIDGMWGSIFSYEGGRFFWKIPKKWRYPVTIRFGKPIYNPSDMEQIRNAVVELGKGKEKGIGD
jgi:acyl-[acyl-carrier-protein]-phospholipid O-acyltransferase / long-chain-fatty-acid--[acyl-carrier-protein] ligase